MCQAICAAPCRVGSDYVVLSFVTHFELSYVVFGSVALGQVMLGYAKHYELKVIKKEIC